MRVRSVKCPTCGGPARIEHGENEGHCLHCGAKIPLSRAVLDEQARARKFPHRTPLRLGMKAQFRGREFEAAGRQVMRENSDGEVSTWEEWVLIAPDGDLLYLEYDEGRWKYSEPFVPSSPPGAAQLAALQEGGFLALDGKTAMVTSAGTYEVAHVEGEFPFVVSVGAKRRYADATSGRAFYSIEWSEEEMEYYRGEFLDDRQVLSMFGLTKLLAAIDRRELVLGSRRKFGAFCLLLALVALIAWGFSMASGRVAPNGSGSVTLASVGPEGTRYGPIQLNAGSRVHRLEIRGYMREQSNWVQAILEDERRQELFAVDKDMWDESGRDSDGPWHESDLHASTDFVVRKTGPYYVRLYTEAGTGRTPSSDAVVRVTVKEKAWTPMPLGLYGFAVLVLGVLFLCASSPSTMNKVWESIQSSD